MREPKRKAADGPQMVVSSGAQERRSFGWRSADGAEAPNDVADVLFRRSDKRGPRDRKASSRTLLPVQFKRPTTQTSNANKWTSGLTIPMTGHIDQLKRIVDTRGRLETVSASVPSGAPSSLATNIPRPEAEARAQKMIAITQITPAAAGLSDSVDREHDSSLSEASTAPASPTPSRALSSFSDQAHDSSLAFAADQGHENAQCKLLCNLGWMHAHGVDVEQDAMEAARLYRLAADQGNARAQNNLGAMLATGAGIPKDAQEAAQLFRRAAEQGHARAQCNLGWMYANGIGVPKDRNEATRLYRLAADQGHSRAQNILGVTMLDRLGHCTN